jgi:hypothetical protein
MTLAKEFEKGGRKVLRYEHDSVPEWGYAKPQQDYFHVLPLAGNPGKPPPFLPPGRAKLSEDPPGPTKQCGAASPIPSTATSSAPPKKQIPSSAPAASGIRKHEVHRRRKPPSG